MSDKTPVGWITPTGQLFPLSAYNPDRHNQYDGHKAGWRHVVIAEETSAPAPLNARALAEAQKFGAGMSDESLEHGEPA